MGAWGYRTFENDPAWDWCVEFREVEDKALFLERTFHPDAFGGYLEVDEGSHIVAAAEILYALAFGPRPCLPDEWKVWAKNKPLAPSTELCRFAVAGLDLVLGSGSEVNELWEENEELYTLWREDVMVLHSALDVLAGEEE